ncbi:PAS domain-containing protein [Gelidibacter sp.]|uniref:PAS domain-containing protein n=1 Tax=Gelidibacter sp. TaxID=2018083 RepID=UPI003267B1B1
MIITSDNSHVFDIAFKAIQQTNTMITFWDNELICRFANNACSYWFGKKPEDMIDKMHMSKMLGYLFEKNLKYINGALSGETQMFERIIDTPDGMIRKGRVIYTPELIDGKVVGFYAYLFDIDPLDMNGQSSTPSVSSYLANSSDEMLYEVKQELEANLLNKFPGLATLANHHMVSESKLKRDFRQKYKIGIFSYYRQLQMKLAADYIR